jgi:lysophospholipase L1-like esterase
MKIVIMADSLAMPRAGETNIAFEATYPYLLEQSLRGRKETQSSIVIERGMRRRTIEYVLDEWQELVELKTPDVVVIHVGIVDCAPRVFLRRERQFVENLRPAWFRDAVLRYVHNHRSAIVKFRNKVYVPPERFKSLLDQVFQKARECKVRSLVFVNIITPPVEMEQRSPGFIKNVQAYNEILRMKVQGEGAHLIDLDKIVLDGGGAAKLTVDGIHINEEGHARLANEIEEHILSLAGRERPSEMAVEYEGASGGTR